MGKNASQESAAESESNEIVIDLSSTSAADVDLKDKDLVDLPEGEHPVVLAAQRDFSRLQAVHSASFDLSILYVLRNEGGYSNHPADHGGPTNYGITQSTYSAYLGRHASAADVKNMPLAVAKMIYKKRYWKQAFELLAQPVATAIMDWGVIHGVTSACQMAQVSATKLGAKCATDGNLGSQSIAAINQLRPAYFVDQYRKDILAWFHHRVATHPDQRVFLNGWENRANRLSTLV